MADRQQWSTKPVTATLRLSPTVAMTRSKPRVARAIQSQAHDLHRLSWNSQARLIGNSHDTMLGEDAQPQPHQRDVGRTGTAQKGIALVALAVNLRIDRAPLTDDKMEEWGLCINDTTRGHLGS